MRKFMETKYTSQMKGQKSLQKEGQGLQARSNAVTLTATNKLSKVISNGQSMRYHLLLKDPFKYNQTQVVDQTCLWKTPLPAIGTGCRKRLIAFKQLQYIIPQWTGDGYPNVIYLDADGVPGYRDAFNFISSHVAALQISEISPSSDESGIKSVDLKYNLRNAVAWQIPDALTQLKFSIKIDTDSAKMVLPLPNTIVTNLDLVIQ